MWGQLSTTCSNSEVAQWGTPGCSQPQPATDNSVRAPPEPRVLQGVNAAYKSQDLLHQPGLEYASTGMPDQRTTCAATQGEAADLT